MNIITIDTGTTNTRLLLWQNNKLVDKDSHSVGVRNTSIDGNNEALISGVRKCLVNLLERNDLQGSDLNLIIASGMITSNLGLYEVPHLTAPVSFDALAQGIVTTTIPEISNTPIHFIPGIKNFDQPSEDQLSHMDIMRGEEVEAVAIAEFYDIAEPAIIALPGSHSKFVGIDGHKNITGCCTTLTGELNSIITQNTILKSSLDGSFTNELDPEAVISGAEATLEKGMGSALFSIRVKEQFGHWTHRQLASFLIGILVQNDIQAMESSSCLGFGDGMSVYVGGESILSQATILLLKHRLNHSRIVKCNEDELQHLSSYGAIQLIKRARLI